MTLSDMTALAILPVTIWVLLGYVARSADKRSLRSNGIQSSRTKEEMVERVHSWAIYGTIAFSAVLIGLVVWARVQDLDVLRAILNSSHWEREVFHGILFGVALGGLLLVLIRFFPEAKKIRILMIAGIASPSSVRVAGLVFIIFTEELWRAACLRVLMSDGFSASQAWLITSIVYTLTFLVWNTSVAISEGVTGAVFGALFLWSGSFFVPLLAHVTLEAQFLLFAINDAQRTEALGLKRSPFARCPICKGSITMRQVRFNPNEVFFCPSCRTRLTVSDRRRWFQRWGSVFVSMALWLAWWSVLPGALTGNELQFWLSLLLALFTGAGLWAVAQVIFPPRLECGDPDFVGLNLGDRNKTEGGKKETSKPDEPDQN